MEGRYDPKMVSLTTLLNAAATGRHDLDSDAYDSPTLQRILHIGLGPLLRFCSRNNSKLDPTARESLRLVSADLTARVLTGELLDAAQEMLAAASACAPEITLLKGISLCQRHYPEPHLRTMGDIDLLVPEKTRPFLEATLRNLGYRQFSEYSENFYATHHHSMPFFHPTRRIWVELHTALFPNTSSVSKDKIFSLQNIEKNIVPFVWQGHRTNHLGDELNVAYISSHWAESFNSVRGLFPMLDIIYILKNRAATFNWDSVLVSLENSVASGHLCLMLTFLERYDLISVPHEAMKTLWRRQRSLNRINKAILHKLLDTYFIQGNPFTAVASESNMSIVWQTLLAPSFPAINLLRLPWCLLCPPAHPLRANLAFQLRRIKSALEVKR